MAFDVLALECEMPSGAGAPGGQNNMAGASVGYSGREYREIED